MKEYSQATTQIKGPLVIVEQEQPASYGELCTIQYAGKKVYGQVLVTSKTHAVIQLFESSQGINRDAKIEFTGKPAQIGLSKDMLGGIFTGMGTPINKQYAAEEYRDINASAINPVMRMPPDDFVQTGISAIDGMSTLVRGQKLPIFSEAGLPHNELAARIVQEADMKGDFAVVFAGLGITNEEADYFIEQFENSNTLQRTVVFLNKASDPSVERIITPRIALTTAEYLAYTCDMQVLVVLTDMTSYCESLREVSNAREEVPGRRGYPGYLYSDLAAQYERAGVIKGKKGSITQLPIITMPQGDKTHPVPDLTGYITEGQVVLEKGLHAKGIYPPINPLPSLSRLMKNGIGDGKTREDHSGVSDQLYASYAYAQELRQLISVIGEGGLQEQDRQYLRFADAFEKQFLNQKQGREIKQTLDIAWELFRMLPKQELKKLKPKHVEEYL